MTKAPLLDTPAVIAAAHTCRDVVDFLTVGLTDVSDVEVSGGRIERDSPRIAKSVCPDLVRTGGTDERVAAGGGRRHRVDTHDRRQQRRRVLAVARGIVLTPPVAKRDVEVAVGTEGEGTSVVVAVGLAHPQQLASGPFVDRIGISARDLVLDDDAIARPGLDVVDVELPGICVVGSKCDAEQASLATVKDHVPDVEVRIGQQGTVLPDLHGAGLVGDENPLVADGRVNIDRKAD